MLREAVRTRTCANSEIHVLPAFPVYGISMRNRDISDIVAIVYNKRLPNGFLDKYIEGVATIAAIAAIATIATIVMLSVLPETAINA